MQRERILRAWAVAAVGATTAYGCQLVAGIDERSLGDAGAIPDTSTAADAPAGDAPTSADAAADGASDAGAVMDAGATNDASFCASIDAANVVFCDDFDQPGRTSMSQQGWTATVTGLPQGVIVTDASASAPASSRFDYGPDAGTMRAGAMRLASFPSGKTQLVVSAVVRVGAGSNFGGFDIGYPCDVQWVMTTGDIQSYCPNYRFLVSSGTIPKETWVPVTLTMTRLGSGDLRVQTAVGSGVGAVTTDNVVPADAGAGSFPTQVPVRLGNAERDGTGVVHFDNVRVETF